MDGGIGMMDAKPECGLFIALVVEFRRECSLGIQVPSEFGLKGVGKLGWVDVDGFGGGFI